MEYNEVLIKLTALIQEETGYALELIQPETTLDSLDLDSLSLLTVLVNAEPIMGVKLVDNLPPDALTVGDVAQFITNEIGKE